MISSYKIILLLILKAVQILICKGTRVMLKAVQRKVGSKAYFW